MHDSWSESESESVDLLSIHFLTKIFTRDDEDEKKKTSRHDVAGRAVAKEGGRGLLTFMPLWLD
jgi:hypothetical protein